jgi:hypothetical protein
LVIALPTIEIEQSFHKEKIILAMAMFLADREADCISPGRLALLPLNLS